jgi:hypothetical protein
MPQSTDKFVVSRQDNIVKVVFSGVQTEESLEEAKQAMIDASRGRVCDMLVDISGIKSSNPEVSGETFFIGLPYRKYAVFGDAPPIVNLSTKQLFTKVADADKVKFFRREEDAHAWLES